MNTKTHEIVEFNCPFCVRPGESAKTPRANEDGEALEDYEIQEIYNNRRYEHYQNDFRNADDLKAHLDKRAKYWTNNSTPAQRESALETVDATVSWWHERQAFLVAEAREKAKKAELQAAQS